MTALPIHDRYSLQEHFDTGQHKDTGNVLPKRYTSKYTKATDIYQDENAGQNFVANASTTKESRCRQEGNGATKIKKLNLSLTTQLER